MVNSRQKGIRGEKALIKYLKDVTGAEFKQTPGSGSGKLKGDIFNPKIPVCIEIKNYKEDPLSSRVLANKTSMIPIWWKKLLGECGKKAPLLFYKWDRSKWYVVTETQPIFTKNYLDFNLINCYILLADEWIEKENTLW